MRAVIQRVTGATVHVGGREVGRCDAGLLVLLGVHKDDDEHTARRMADRIYGLRIFSDAAGRMNLGMDDLREPDGALSMEVLAVSNFTVYGDASKSRRPSFTASASYDRGQELFERVVAELRARGVRTATGEFGAEMRVSLVNDGPVTLILEVDAA
jgi:D-tyrosyl-tRNA(Tyr) deacylase